MIKEHLDFISALFPFRSIEEDRIEEMFSNVGFEIRSYKKGQTVVREGSRMHEIGFVYEGECIIENVHDKDNAVPHYHIYLNLGFSPASCFDVASWLQLPCWSVNILKGHARDLFLYFMHSAGCEVNKHEYSISDFVSNFDIEALISGRRQ